jgi:aspartyl-tRNA(Asn)/glutamyl-tRNA(Gln) amidotransferase subunit A
MMYRKTAVELAKMFREGALSAVEIATYFLNRAKILDKDVGAFLRLMPERVMKKAHELDAKRARGEPLGKLAGVPIAVKDNMNIKGELTTCASKFLENHRAIYDATVITAMEKEDALLLGKTNMDEFAMGSSNERSAFQMTRNPWAPNCVPGGSSGGSAAAVSARFCPISLGSDTGGSIRQPAAFTGTYGFKPTYGRVSRYGLVAFASSLDQIGPFANSVEDIALMMEVLGKHCPHDGTSINRGMEPYLDELDQPIQGKKVGVPWQFLENFDGELRTSFDNSLEHMRNLGLEIVEVDLNIVKYAIPMYYILSTAEASTNLARFDGVQYSSRSKEAKTLDDVYDLSRNEGFGSEVKKRIMLGTHVLASGYQDAYYNKARKVRTLLIENFKKAFSTCDVIAMPTTTTPAFPFGSIVDAAEMHMQDLYTVSANLAGIPGISLPVGLTTSEKPIGIQFLAPQLEDARVLRFAHHLAKATSFSPNIPKRYNREV